MLRILCPKCNKDSYSASVENFKPCPYCGVIFSGKYGAEKRREYRKNTEIPCVCSYKDHELKATTVNFSNNGISLKIFGTSSLPVGDTLDILLLGDSPIQAEVKWVTNPPDASVALTGLKIVNGSLNSIEL
jgi:hypothetical protein